jgi:hypothetical protein
VKKAGRVVGAAAGLPLAVLLFKSLKLDQCPRVVGRVGLGLETSNDEENV